MKTLKDAMKEVMQDGKYSKLELVECAACVRAI